MIATTSGMSVTILGTLGRPNLDETPIFELWIICCVFAEQRHETNRGGPRTVSPSLRRAGWANCMNSNIWMDERLLRKSVSKGWPLFRARIWSNCPSSDKRNCQTGQLEVCTVLRGLLCSHECLGSSASLVGQSDGRYKGLISDDCNIFEIIFNYNL